MPMLEKRAVAHFGVRGEGQTQVLCRAWHSMWNWTLVRAEVTCPECRTALAALAVTDGDGPSR